MRKLGVDNVAVPKSQADWQKENTVVYRIRVTKSSGIPAAMEDACTYSEKTAPEYLRLALENQLQKDGYLQKLK